MKNGQLPDPGKVRVKAVKTGIWHLFALLEWPPAAVLQAW